MTPDLEAAGYATEKTRVDKTTQSNKNENSNINYHNANTPCDYNNGYPMMNGGVFSASYADTPAYTDTPGNVTTSELSQSYPLSLSDSPHPPQ
ncbi:hypothetical protein RhiirA4_475293 [Rhizophagus irregularis]|uniref:Uncharacterized protein n=1 Tax=Rhizophagus irregularis TaxID=588596 RepID=A0A2I1H9X1_9GLOM|nr:hypothetical protein RhiirA4_475293 [Rhizophagus irregularis]